MIRRTKASPSVPRAMDAGDLAPLIAAYKAELEGLGHSRLTVSGHTDAARHVAAWLRQTGLAFVDLNEGLMDQFARHRCRCGGSRRGDRVSSRYVRRARQFVAFLVDRGILAASVVPAGDAMDPPVAEYLQWLACHRGTCDSTIQRHGRMIMRLMAVLGREPRAYDAGSIRSVIVAEAQNCTPSYVKTMTTALRGYLRFLGAQGIRPAGLEGAVPLVPQWRLSSLPRYLPATDVERLIASCDLGTVHGVRDRAILLLLARLGLRAGDVRKMQLDDVDWAAGTIRVSGKGHREVRLPLPQEVGDALLAYLDQQRLTTNGTRLFVRSRAPYLPFTSPSTVSSIVRLALRRAGIKDAPSTGANLLRHSAATAMLRGGATLQSVGAVLRHRSLDTTAHYAKVDLPMLQQIAQPWPGERSC